MCNTKSLHLTKIPVFLHLNGLAVLSQDPACSLQATHGQRLETDNSYHVATASLLTSFQASQLFSTNGEEAHSSLQLLERPQKVDSTRGESTDTLHAVREGLVDRSFVPTERQSGNETIHGHYVVICTCA